MPTKQEFKAIVCAEIDRRRDWITDVSKTILDNPETGFREVKTSRLVRQKFDELGLSYRDGLAITGVKAVVQGGASGPAVAVMGELDSLIVSDHPKADPKTGAAHVCGHHAQVGMMLGVAAGLKASGVLSALSGRVALMAVPAEEYIEVEFRNGLRRQGRLSYLGGKSELVKLGEFDDVDMAIMIHNNTDPDMGKLGLGGTMNGCVAKLVQFIGRSAHAGGMPHRGINALNAAMIAISAIHAQRETFQDNDTIRVHPIITRGGEAVNAVPADVHIETYVRGKTLEAIKDANTKVDRALRAGALAIGAKVRITTLPGYFPLLQNPLMQELFRENAVALVGQDEVRSVGHRTGSTDMGDLSHIMPVIHPFAGGVTGTSHGSDYLVQDYELAVINPAKAMAMLVIDLLADGAIKARGVLAQSKPSMTKEQYLATMEGFLKEELYDGAA